MTIQEFDGLLRAGLAAAAQRDLEAAWAAQGPAPACSAGYLAWQEQFLSDPVGTAGRAQRRASPLRRAARLALIAALAALLLVGCAVALVPGFSQYWSTQVTNFIHTNTGEPLTHYQFELNESSLLVEFPELEDVQPDKFQHWYPQSLPKLPENRYYEIEFDDPGFLVFALRSTEPSEQEYTFGELFLEYQILHGTYEYHITSNSDSQLHLEEVSIDGLPGFFLYTGPEGTSLHCLIWFDPEHRIVFRTFGYWESGGCTEEQLLEIAFHMETEKPVL